MSSRQGKKGKDFWGEPAWILIHSIATTYQPEKAQAFKKFMEALSELLPCEVCQQNLKHKLQTTPPDQYLKNNHDCFFWTYMIHDLVNQSSNKDPRAGTPRQSPQYDDVKRLYFTALSSDCRDCKIPPK